jgi:hypothetical protein
MELRSLVLFKNLAWNEEKSRYKPKGGSPPSASEVLVEMMDLVRMAKQFAAFDAMGGPPGGSFTSHSFLATSRASETTALGHKACTLMGCDVELGTHRDTRRARADRFLEALFPEDGDNTMCRQYLTGNISHL